MEKFHHQIYGCIQRASTWGLRWFRFATSKTWCHPWEIPNWQMKKWRFEWENHWDIPFEAFMIFHDIPWYSMSDVFWSMSLSGMTYLPVRFCDEASFLVFSPCWHPQKSQGFFRKCHFHSFSEVKSLPWFWWVFPCFAHDISPNPAMAPMAGVSLKLCPPCVKAWGN